MGDVIYSREDRVYWNETDTAQIAHFSSIFKFCEETEEEFFRLRTRRAVEAWKRNVS